ncbi:MAG TPA: hypothetical protein VIB11_06990 [Pedococcus sp.]|uniref:hypothetical protein n=1 Tax=Pedococcus sp. TaxID=2860345 RepID=UPI002F94155A
MLLLAVASSVGVGATGSSARAETTAMRSMWVWDVSTPAATVDLAAASGIGQLFVAVPPRLNRSPLLPKIREISQRAAAAGIRVDALGGDPGWVDNPTWVVDHWLRPALSSRLFTGVHVDIEPYTTPAWESDRAGVVQRYLETLTALDQAAGATPVEADIPFWFHEVPAGATTLDREIMARTAGVTVMAYRNTAAGDDGTIALASPALQAGAEVGRPVRIGQETNYLGDSPVETKQTFHGRTRTAMETQLAEVEAAFGGSPWFAGISIHDAAGYAAMAP